MRRRFVLTHDTGQARFGYRRVGWVVRVGEGERAQGAGGKGRG